MGASQNRRSGTSSGTTPVPYPPFHTPVPYPRSIPLFHTSLKDPFHTSVPYLCSIPLIHTLYMCMYLHIHIYLSIWICAVWFFHLYPHTWAHIHTWVFTCKNTFTMPKPCDCVGRSVPASFVVMVGMCLAAVSWQSKNGLLVTLPPSQPVAGLRLHHLQLLPAVAQLWCLMVEMRLAVASWQSKNCLLRYSRSKLPILIKMCCMVAELCWSGPRCVPDPVPYRSIPVSGPDHPCTIPGPLPGEQMAGSHIDCS